MKSRDSVAFWADPANTARLRALFDEGLGPTEIARRMGVSRGAVVGRIWRLGLVRAPARPKPPRGPRSRPTADAAVRVPPATPEPAPPTIAMPGVVAARAGDRPPTADPRVEDATPALGIQGRQADRPRRVEAPGPGRRGRVVECSFVTATSGRTHRFCNAPSVPGSAWCAEHRRRCIVVPTQKTNFGASA